MHVVKFDRFESLYFERHREREVGGWDLLAVDLFFTADRNSHKASYKNDTVTNPFRAGVTSVD